MKQDWPSDEAYRQAAWLLAGDADPRLVTRALKAVAEVEAGDYGAFLDSGEPVILFERHKFEQFTGGRFSTRYPELSSKKRGGYGKVNQQHEKLKRAIELDRVAALKSCSWGLFQLMGFNYKRCGFQDNGMRNDRGMPLGLQRFVNAMYRSVDDHLRAFTMFIRSDSRLVDALRIQAFSTFALYYNGEDFRENKYDQRMYEAFETTRA